MTVRIERMPQGKMRNYVVKYVSACNLSFPDMDRYIYTWMGNGEFFLTFVDDSGKPLNEFGSMWVRLALDIRE